MSYIYTTALSENVSTCGPHTPPGDSVCITKGTKSGITLTLPGGRRRTETWGHKQGATPSCSNATNGKIQNQSEALWYVFIRQIKWKRKFFFASLFLKIHSCTSCQTTKNIKSLLLIPRSTEHCGSNQCHGNQYLDVRTPGSLGCNYHHHLRCNGSELCEWDTVSDLVIPIHKRREGEGQQLIKLEKFWGVLTPSPLSLPYSHNLPFVGQDLGTPSCWRHLWMALYYKNFPWLCEIDLI